MYTPISKKMAKYDVKCKQHELMETSKRKYTEQKETVWFHKSMLYETIAEHQDSGVQTSSDFSLLFKYFQYYFNFIWNQVWNQEI